MVIAREALDRLSGTYDFADDSSGSVASAAYDLLAVHLRACQVVAARTRFARRLPGRAIAGRRL